MRILDVSPRVTLPLSSGSRIRMYNLLSRISQRNDVRQFSQTRTRDLRRPGFAKEAQITPSYREYRYQNSLGSALCEAMERTGFGVPFLCGYPLSAAKPRRLREWVDWADLVVVEFPWQYACCRSMAKSKPVVLAAHNVQAAKVRSGGNGGAIGLIWGSWTETLERQAVRGADLVLAVSREDREEFARRYVVDAGKVTVIPNGADIDLYQPADEATRAALRRRLGLPTGPTVIFPAPRSRISSTICAWLRIAACRFGPPLHEPGTAQALAARDGFDILSASAGRLRRRSEQVLSRLAGERGAA